MKETSTGGPADRPLAEGPPPGGRARMAVLESILDSAADAVVAFDRELRYAYVSPSAARILGRSPEWLIGKRSEDVHPPEIARPWKQLAERVFESGRPVRDETPYTGTDGDRIYEYIMTPVRDQGGQVELVVSVARDVTEQRRAQHALAAANAAEQRARRRAVKLHTVAAALARATSEEEVAAAMVNEGMEALEAEAAVAYLVDAAGRQVLRASRGLAPETIARHAILLPDAPVPLADAIRSGEPIWIESLDELLTRYPITRDSKTPASKLQAVAAIPLRSNQRTVGGVAFSFGASRLFDDDERRFLLTVVNHAAVAGERCQLRQEEETARNRLTLLAAASRRFSEAKLELRDTLDTISREVATRLGESCAINLLSDDGQVLEPVAIANVDPAAEEATRRTMAAAPVRMDEGSSLSRVVKTGEPVHIPEIPPGWLAATGRPEYRDYHQRFPIGTLLVVPLRARGAIIGTITAARGRAGPAYTRDDMFLLEELAARAGLAIANARQHEALGAAAAENARLFQSTREAVAVRDDFLSIASHELNTPLAALQLQIQSLKRQADKEQLSARFLERMKKTEAQVARIERLVSELLDVSRITGGRLDIEREPMDLMAAVTDVAERLAPQAATSGCSIRLAGPAELWGSWDRLRIEQVVTNLIANSIKYGPGQPIEVSVAVDGERARITVRDFGIGISPEDEARIFGRFERAVSQRHYGGLGLGLWIARQIVEAHGGSIQFQRPADVGTRFIVELDHGRPA